MADVSLTFTARNGAVEMTPTFTALESSKQRLLALYEYSISVQVPNAHDAARQSLLWPSGFGLLYQGLSSIGTGLSDVYPAELTMQHLSYYDPQHGTYFATHDIYGSTKTFQATPAGGGNGVVLAVSIMPPDACVALAVPYTPSFPVVVRPFAGDWYDASCIYRDWVLQSSVWSSGGPVSAPPWLQDTTTWVNSHWQQFDIFNVTGGDPATLSNRMALIKERFGLKTGQLALHWYEWDLLGYEPPDEYLGPCPPESEYCGFDTNYPLYFPVRSNFSEALKNMHNIGVSVVPYINGRIYDQHQSTWETDEASSAKTLRTATSVSSASSVAVDSVGLDLYNESYGSKALFAVMCPHAEGWQDTISSTVDELVNVYGVDGVYIDQIGAAKAKPCFDPTHDHQLGGGDFWVAGYRQMLAKTRLVSDGKTIMTEGNCEAFIGSVDLFLSLSAFFGGDYSRNSAIRVVPSFSAVYGGYYTAAGAEFFQADFESSEDGSVSPGDVFAARLTTQFLTGAQLGWMSLGGRDNQNPPMGLFELLMDSEQDASIEFLKTLSNARSVLASTFNQGRASRDIEYSVASVASLPGERPYRLTREAPHAARGRGRGHAALEGRTPTPSQARGLEYDAVAAQVFVDARVRADPGESLTVLFVGVALAQPGPLLVSFKMDASRFGLGVSGTELVTLTLISMMDGSESYLGDYQACCIDATTELLPRSVSALRVRLKTSESKA